MIDVSTNDFPPFLEQEFERMMIPGDGDGFAISRSTSKGEEGTACGLHGNTAICVSYSGEEYSVRFQKPISRRTFEDVCNTVPDGAKRSGFLGAEDILDGKTDLVKWSWSNQTTRLVLCNPQLVDDEAVKELVLRLDEVLKKANEARKVADRKTSASPVQKLPAGDRD